MIDDALLRPGRLGELIYVPPPDLETRKKIFEVYTSRIHADESVNLDELAEKTKGFSGADIEGVCREAVFEALRRDINTQFITQEMLLSSIAKTKPSITEDMIKHYKEFQDAFYQE